MLIAVHLVGFVTVSVAVGFLIYYVVTKSKQAKEIKRLKIIEAKYNLIIEEHKKERLSSIIDLQYEAGHNLNEIYRLRNALKQIQDLAGSFPLKEVSLWNKIKNDDICKRYSE